MALFKGNSTSSGGAANQPKRSALVKQRPSTPISGGEELEDFIPTNFGATKVAEGGSGRIFRGQGAQPVEEFHPQLPPPKAAEGVGKIFGYRRQDAVEKKLPPLSAAAISVPTGDEPPKPKEPEAPPPPPPEPIDEKIIAAAQAKAQELLQQAQAKAQEFLQQAQGQIEQLQQQALVEAEQKRQEAKELGTRQGIEEGQRLAHQQYVDLMLQARDLYVQAIKERRQLIEATEPALAKLSIDIAEKIIGLEISTSGDVIMGVVKEALSDMKDREEVRIRVNPDDYHIVNNDRSALMRMVEGLKDFDLSVDSKVARGGCIIETNLGNIDARLETQLAAIRTAFDRSANGEDGDDGANAN